MDFLNHAPPFLQAFWLIAFTASLVFTIQILANFISSGDGDFEIETEIETGFEGLDSAAEFFTFKNLVYFFLGFGWTGVLFFEHIQNPILLLSLALGVGLCFVFLFFFIIKQLLKLGEDNSFQLSETLLKTADVYLSIPEKLSGKGKIHVSVRGSLHELEAQTEGERLPTGTKVIVKDITPENVLLVERLG
jgi:hypothetical protein